MTRAMSHGEIETWHGHSWNDRRYFCLSLWILTELLRFDKVPLKSFTIFKGHSYGSHGSFFIISIPLRSSKWLIRTVWTFKIVSLLTAVYQIHNQKYQTSTEILKIPEFNQVIINTQSSELKDIIINLRIILEGWWFSSIFIALNDGASLRLEN